MVSRRNTGSIFCGLDPQGNVCQRLVTTGAVLSSHFFDAFGIGYSSPNPPSNTAYGPFGYGGQWGYYTDGETGLGLLTNRYYDAGTRRFLTRDPIGYGYVGNGPLAGIDPLGLCGTQSGDLLDWSANFFAGWADTLSFGATILTREGLGVNGVVNRHREACVGTRLGDGLRRPAAERTPANKNAAISFAAYRALVDLFLQPEQVARFAGLMRRLGYDPADGSTDLSRPSGIGNVAAAAVPELHHHGGAN